MRYAFLLTSAALAIAAPAAAQTVQAGRTPMPMPAPTATPAAGPDTAGTPAATPAPPAATPAPATQPATPPASATPMTPATPGAATAPATPQAAPTPIGPSVGATVYGAAGAPVGTIKDMNDQYVTLTTDKGDVRLPVAGVGPGLKGPVIGLTAAQLDAAVTQAQAAQPAAVTTQTKTTTKTTKTAKKAR